MCHADGNSGGSAIHTTVDEPRIGLLPKRFRRHTLGLAMAINIVKGKRVRGVPPIYSPFFILVVANAPSP